MSEPADFHLEHPHLKVNYLPDDYLKRMDAVYALNELGCSATYESLARMALRRIGPPFIKRGRLALYRYGDLVAWAEEEIKYYPAWRRA